jgi:dTDP-D-glucose 4,6-dehydratase
MVGRNCSQSGCFSLIHRNYGIPVRVARYHNIFGPEGTWEGGREKAPAAICRKVAYLPEEGGTIEVWGDGLQTRSFLYIDECIEATRRMMDSDFQGPVNIGSEEMVTINQLVDTAAKVAGKNVEKNHIDGPLGVRGRNSNNDLIREKLGWDYSQTLEEGIRKTYNWIIFIDDKNQYGDEYQGLHFLNIDIHHKTEMLYNLIMEMLILSKCDRMLLMNSNISHMSLFFSETDDFEFYDMHVNYH